MLSERERRELEELEKALAAEDPALAKRMRTPRPAKAPKAPKAAKAARTPQHSGSRNILPAKTSWWKQFIARMEERWERRMRESGRY